MRQKPLRIVKWIILWLIQSLKIETFSRHIDQLLCALANFVLLLLLFSPKEGLVRFLLSRQMEENYRKF